MDDAALHEVIAAVDEWPVDTVAIGVTTADATIATHGPVHERLPLASVTKPLSAVGVLVAAQQGAVHVDESAGPPGATVRHLLAHASGLPINPGGRTQHVEAHRVYSNVGFDLLGDLVAQRVGEPFASHLRAEVFAPLGMDDTELAGSPAHAATSTVVDLLALARELLRANLLDDQPWQALARVQFPGLDGVVPGYGRHTPCPWGLGVEIRGTKHTHWTGSNQPRGVFGHFGQTGSFLWVDRDNGVAAVVLTDREFGPWAVARWQPFNTDLATALDATAPHHRRRQ